MGENTFVKDYSEFKSEEDFETDVLKETLKKYEDIEYIKLDEGLLKTLAGGTVGLVIGPNIGKSICKALGVERGMLYDLLTSRIFTTLLATYIAKKS